MKNALRSFAFMLILMASIGISSMAETKDENENPVDAFIEAFNLEPEDLIFVPVTAPLETAPSDLYAYVPSTETNYNTLGSFAFSRGLDRLKFSTFSCEKTLIGEGSEGLSIGVMVYRMEENNPVYISGSTKRLGASGLYNETVVYRPETKQCMIVAVSNGFHTVSRVYEVTTKEEATKTLLENIEIQFLPDEPTTEVPSFEMPALVDFDF